MEIHSLVYNTVTGYTKHHGPDGINFVQKEELILFSQKIETHTVYLRHYGID